MSKELFISLFVLIACSQPQLQKQDEVILSLIDTTSQGAFKKNIEEKIDTQQYSAVSKTLLNGKKEINNTQVTQDSIDLKSALLKKGIYFGTVLTSMDINQKPPRPSNYMEEVSNYFNFYTISVSFPIVEPKQRGVFDFRGPDKIVAFAKAHNAKVKGHALVMGNISSIPDWIKTGNYSPEELRDILKTHVQTIVKHFRDKFPGVVTEWNVVNEPVCNGGKQLCFSEAGIGKNIWTVIHKPNSNDPTDYIQLAFQWAREADPSAKLYLNENKIETEDNPKTDRVYNLVKYLKQKGTPIDGIGFQCHIWFYDKDKYSLEGFTNIMNKFASLGLKTQISEFDVIMASGKTGGSSTSQPIPMGIASKKDLDRQADLYKLFLTACLKAKNCTGFTVWGPWDEGSWTYLHWKGDFQPHILDKSMHPKLTYKALINAVEQNKDN